MSRVAEKGRKRVKDNKKEGRRPRDHGSSGRSSLQFTGKNYGLLAAGIVAIAIGYLLLAQGSITLAPILLILGYCVLIPIAIIIR
jgi:hypothetical protein